MVCCLATGILQLSNSTVHLYATSGLLLEGTQLTNLTPTLNKRDNGQILIFHDTAESLVIK